jgi:hypothetical protein
MIEKFLPKFRSMHVKAALNSHRILEKAEAEREARQAAKTRSAPKRAPRRAAATRKRQAA